MNQQLCNSIWDLHISFINLEIFGQSFLVRKCSYFQVNDFMDGGNPIR